MTVHGSITKRKPVPVKNRLRECRQYPLSGLFRRGAGAGDRLSGLGGLARFAGQTAFLCARLDIAQRGVERTVLAIFRITLDGVDHQLGRGIARQAGQAACIARLSQLISQRHHLGMGIQCRLHLEAS